MELDVQTSKYGQALTVKTSNFAGGLKLGFRIDDNNSSSDSEQNSRVSKVMMKLKHLLKIYMKKPNFGVYVKFVDEVEQSASKPLMIDNQIVYDGDENGLDDAETENIDTVENTPKGNVQFQENPNSAYIIDEYLGLAIKKSEANYSTAKTWRFL